MSYVPASARWAASRHAAVRGAQSLKQIVGRTVFLKDHDHVFKRSGPVLGVGCSRDKRGSEKQ